MAYADYEKKSAAISRKMQEVRDLVQEAYVNDEKDSDGKSLSYDQLLQTITKRKGIKKLTPFDSDIFSERIKNLDRPKRSSRINIPTSVMSNKSISPVQKARISLYTKARWADNKKAINYLKSKGVNKFNSGTITLADRTIRKVE